VRVSPLWVASAQMGQGAGVSERSRMWGEAPNRWTPTPAIPDRTAWAAAPPVATAQRMVPVGWAAKPSVEPDRAEPTDGRHAFDRDAALTPIFTALRRGGRRRLRTGSPPLRLAPEPVERFRADPPTSPIPVVPALHALDPYPTGGYSAASVDSYPTGVHRSAADRAVVDPYAPGAPRAVPPPASPNETTAVWHLSDDPAAYSPVTSSSVTSPVTDTGRHHRRLAPAGW
jgi:hypothetical protein